MTFFYVYAFCEPFNTLANTAHVLIDTYNEIQQWEQK